MDVVFNEDMSIETIVLGGGCFWCTEAVFKMLKGIIYVRPGYSGGHTENPIYEEVCSGDTGHAEVVEVKFDSDIISLDKILTVFFATHDPTSLNRQGNDVGEQYRSIIFYTSEAQKKEINKFIEEINMSATQGKPIVTQVKPLVTFYEAEISQKDYYKKNPKAAYCRSVINPKLEKVKKNFAKLLKK